MRPNICSGSHSIIFFLSHNKKIFIVTERNDKYLFCFCFFLICDFDWNEETQIDFVGMWLKFVEFNKFENINMNILIYTILNIQYHLWTHQSNKIIKNVMNIGCNWFTLHLNHQFYFISLLFIKNWCRKISSSFHSCQHYDSILSHS